MRKIFGILSLIAILTVSFTTKASAVDTDNNVEFVVNLDSPDFVAVATVDAVSIEGVEVVNLVEYTSIYATVGEDVYLPDIVSSELLNEKFVNVSDKAENYTNSKEDFSVNIVSKDSVIEFADFTKSYLPIEVGLLNGEFDNEYTANDTPNLNEYVSEYNNTYGYETPDFFAEISANVGKLTTLKI